MTYVCDHDRSSETDGEVHDPIGSARDFHSTSSHVEWEDFGGNDPSEWTPCHGEVGKYQYTELDISTVASFTCFSTGRILRVEGASNLE